MWILLHFIINQTCSELTTHLWVADKDTPDAEGMFPVHPVVLNHVFTYSTDYIISDAGAMLISYNHKSNQRAIISLTHFVITNFSLKLYTKRVTRTTSSSNLSYRKYA